MKDSFTVAGVKTTSAAGESEKITVATLGFPATIMTKVAVPINLPIAVAGNIAATGLTDENDQYTYELIEFNKQLNDGKYQAATDYIATIRLEAKDGYTLNGVSANLFKTTGVKSVTITLDSQNNPDKTKGTIKVTFNKTAATITNSAAFKTIKGITRPMAGAESPDKITDTAQYTGAVKWASSDGTELSGGAKFELETYIATVTMEAKLGYSFFALPENYFTVDYSNRAIFAFDPDDPTKGVLTVEFAEAYGAYYIDYEAETLRLPGNDADAPNFEYRIKASDVPLTAAELKSGWTSGKYNIGAGKSDSVALKTAVANGTSVKPYVIYVRIKGDVTDGGNSAKLFRCQAGDLKAVSAYKINSGGASITLNKPYTDVDISDIMYGKTTALNRDGGTLRKVDNSNSYEITGILLDKAFTMSIQIKANQDEERFASAVGGISVPSLSAISNWGGLAITDLVDFAGAPANAGGSTAVRWKLSDKAKAFGDNFEFSMSTAANKTGTYQGIVPDKEIPAVIYNGDKLVNIYVRRKASDNDTASNVSGALGLAAMAGAPGAIFDKVNMTINGVTDKMEYSLNGGTTWSTINAGEKSIKVEADWFENGSNSYKANGVQDGTLDVLVRTAATTTKIYSKNKVVNVAPIKEFSTLNFAISDLLAYNPQKGTLTYLSVVPDAFKNTVANGGSGYTKNTKIEISANGGYWIAITASTDVRSHLTGDNNNEILIRFQGNANVTTSAPIKIKLNGTAIDLVPTANP